MYIVGQIYYDFGFDHWIFLIEQTAGRQIADRLREKHGRFNEIIDRIYQESINFIKHSWVDIEAIFGYAIYDRDLKYFCTLNRTFEK